MCFCVSVDQFVSVLLAFVVFGLESSVPSQEIGSEVRLRNDPFCVESDTEPYINNSMTSASRILIASWLLSLPTLNSRTDTKSSFSRK